MKGHTHLIMKDPASFNIYEEECFPDKDSSLVQMCPLVIYNFQRSNFSYSFTKAL